MQLTLRSRHRQGNLSILLRNAGNHHGIAILEFGTPRSLSLSYAAFFFVAASAFGASVGNSLPVNAL